MICGGGTFSRKKVPPPHPLLQNLGFFLVLQGVLFCKKAPPAPPKKLLQKRVFGFFYLCARRRLLFNIKAIFFPIHWIEFNVIPNVVVIVLLAYDVVMEGALENCFTPIPYFTQTACQRFKRTHNVRYCRGGACSSRRFP